jgi:hypothetical protein
VKQAHAGSSCQGVAHHAGSGIGGKRRPPTEIRVTPESEKWLKERAAGPEGQKLLDELAMVFVEAAVEGCSRSKRFATPCKLVKLFKFYSNKYRRNSLNRPRPTI